MTLGASYPNPAHEAVSIPFTLAERVPVTLRLYDVLGREVRTLFTGVASPGEYIANLSAGALTPGTYYYKLSAPSYLVTRSLVIVR